MQSIRQSLKTCYFSLDAPLARKDFVIGILSILLLLGAMLFAALGFAMAAKSASAGLLASLFFLLAIPASLAFTCIPPIYILIWGWRRGLCSPTPESGKWMGLALAILSITLLPIIGCVTLLIWPDPPRTQPLPSIPSL